MNRTRQALILIAAIGLAFIIGFGWQFARAERIGAELNETREALIYSELENTLAAATVSAQIGAYEAARVYASDFFTGLQQHVQRAPASARSGYDTILAERDAAITMLSRGEPRADETMVRLLARYRVARGGEERALPVGSAHLHGGAGRPELPPQSAGIAASGHPASASRAARYPSSRK